MAFYDQLGSFFVGETEEERRRREEQEAADNAVPFKQTIVTDPVTGRQTMKMEGALEDFTAANPNTPTVTGPVAPGAMTQREEMPTEQYVGTPGFNPAAAPVMPEAPVTFSDIRGQEVEMQPQVGGEPTMTAAVPGAATGAPTKSQAQLELERRQQGTTAPTMEGVMAGPPREAMPTPEQGETPSLATAKSYAERFEQAKKALLEGDDSAMGMLAYSKDVDPGYRREAAALLRKFTEAQQGENRAKEILQKSLDSNNMLDVQREMKKNTTEGSWMRYLIYGLLGSERAAIERGKLFGDEGFKTTAFQLPNGEAGILRTDVNTGDPIYGITSTGRELSRNELVGAMAGVGTGDVKRALRLPDGTMINELKNGSLVVGNTKQRFMGDTRQLLTEEQYKTVNDRANNAGQEAAKAQRERTPGDPVAIQKAFDDAKRMVLGPVSGYGEQTTGAGITTQTGTGAGPVKPGTTTQTGTGAGTATTTTTATTATQSRPATTTTGQPWYGAPRPEASPTPGPNESDAAFKSRLAIQEDKAKFFNGAEPAGSLSPVTRAGVSGHSVKAEEAEQIFRDMNKIITDNPQIAGTGRVNSWYDYGLKMATGGFSREGNEMGRDRDAIIKNLDPRGRAEFEKFEALAQRAANTVAKEVNPAGAFQESDAVRAAKQTFSNLKDLGPSVIIDGTRNYAQKNLKDKMFGEFVRNRPDLTNIDQARVEFNQVFKPYEAQINAINEVRIKTLEKEMGAKFGADWKDTYNRANKQQQQTINNYLTAKVVELERRYGLPRVVDGQLVFDNKDQQFAAKFGLDQYRARKRP